MYWEHQNYYEGVILACILGTTSPQFSVHRVLSFNLHNLLPSLLNENNVKKKINNDVSYLAIKKSTHWENKPDSARYLPPRCFPSVLSKKRK